MPRSVSSKSLRKRRNADKVLRELGFRYLDTETRSRGASAGDVPVGEPGEGRDSPAGTTNDREAA